MRKYLLPLLLMVALLLSACGGDKDKDEDNKDSDTNAQATAVEKYQIALVMKTLTNPFFIEMERGGRQAEQEFGIELIVRTAAQETSIEQQIQIIEELIVQKVDAIVIAPGDSQALVPVLKKAQDAGIIIINIDNRLDPEVSASAGLVGVPFISVNNEEGAYLAGEYLSSQVTEPTQAIILEGIQTAQNAQDRKNGVVRAFEENENIEIVAQQTANWKIDEAYTVTKELLELNPDVKLIFAANDMMALGAIQYLDEAGREDILVGGFDALEDAKQAIRNGDLDVTIDQQAALQGYTGVQFAVRALNGEELPAETMVDVLVVNTDNVE